MGGAGLLQPSAAGPAGGGERRRASIRTTGAGRGSNGAAVVALAAGGWQPLLYGGAGAQPRRPRGVGRPSWGISACWRYQPPRATADRPGRAGGAHRPVGAGRQAHAPDRRSEPLATALDALKDSEFIYEQAIYPEVEYTFKHALTQEVAAQGLLADRRRVLHRLVGEAIEGLYADRLDEYAGALAHHFAQSDDQEKAVRYLHLAGVRALRLGAVTEAMALLEDARTRARKLPQSEEHDRRRMQILRDSVFPVLMRLEEGWEARLEAIDEEAMGIAVALDSFSELALLYSSRSFGLALTMGPAGALGCVEKLRSLAGRLPDDELAWHIGYARGAAQWVRGELRPALLQVRELLKRRDLDRLPVMALSGLSPATELRWREITCLARLGELDEAESLLGHLRVEMGEDLTLTAKGLLRGTDARYLLVRGRVEQALPAFEESLRYYDQSGFRRGSVAGREGLANAMVVVGRLREAVDLFTEAVEMIGGRDWSSANALRGRAIAYLALGLVEEARKDAEAALALALEFENRSAEGEARVSIALIHAASTPPDYAAAEDEFAQADKCLRECEARTALVLALRLHGETRLKLGDGAGAEPLLREARALFAYMGRKDDVEAIDALLEKAQAAESAAGSTVQNLN